DVGIALFLRRQCRSAFWAMRRHLEFAFGAVTQFDDRTEDLRDHVARFAQHHRVAEQHALPASLAGVVQGGHLDSGPGYEYRFHHAVRGYPAGTPYVDADIEQLGVDLFGRVFEGNRPSRRPAGATQLALLGQRVDLHHDSVDLMLDVMAVFAVVVDELDDLVERADDLGAVGGRKTPAPEPLVPLRLSLDLSS